MKVLTVTSLFPGKSRPYHGIFVYHRMASFAQRGHEVTVIAPVPRALSWFPKRWSWACEVPLQEQFGGVDVYHPRYSLFPRMMPLHGWLMYRGALECAERLHHEHRFDVVDGHYLYPDGFAAARIAERLNLPLILSGRGTDVNLFPSFRTIRPMISWALSRSRAGIGVSNALVERMREISGGKTPIFEVANGVDSVMFRPTSRAEARRALQLPNSVKIMVSVGSLRETKGHQRLIEALSRSGRQDILLYIIGDGNYRPHLLRLIQEQGLQDRVSLMGPRDHSELPLWFSAADLSALCSSQEGWPNVILESIACGTPVLATRVGGVPEIIAKPALGVLVDQDPESIRKGLEQALAMTWDRDELVRYAQTRSWDVVARELETVLNTVLDSSHVPVAVGDRAD